MSFEEVGYFGDVARALKEITTAVTSAFEVDEFDRARTGSGCQLPGVGAKRSALCPACDKPAPIPSRFALLPRWL